MQNFEFYLKKAKIYYENILARYSANTFPVSSQYETKTSYLLALANNYF